MFFIIIVRSAFPRACDRHPAALHFHQAACNGFMRPHDCGFFTTIVVQLYQHLTSAFW